MTLKKDSLQSNTIYTYKRMAAYLLIYCEEKSYSSVNIKPSIIVSGLSALKRFLSLYHNIRHLKMELPSRLPRERKIPEICANSDINAINKFYQTTVSRGVTKPLVFNYSVLI